MSLETHYVTVLIKICTFINIVLQAKDEVLDTNVSGSTSFGQTQFDRQIFDRQTQYNMKLVDQMTGHSCVDQTLFRTNICRSNGF
jgi:hypothetical protein